MWLKEFIKIIFGLGLFINAALFIPQAIKLYRAKNSEELSLMTFGGFCFFQTTTILYGIMIKDYLLIVGYGLSLLTCGIVTLMIILYRR